MKILFGAGSLVWLMLGMFLPDISWAAEETFASKFRITPKRLGLPEGNGRTSEAFVTRIYKTDSIDRILKKQPQGYPFTVKSDYKLKEQETCRVHKGVDLSSRPGKGKAPIPLDFYAGVYGIVVKAGDGNWGTIAVEIADGTLIQYLHTSLSHVKVGDVVSPKTKLGATGRTGASVIHLHIQAKQNGNAILPDLAFLAGQTPLQSKAKSKTEPQECLFDPELWTGIKPKLVEDVVKPGVAPKSVWIVEVIGKGGRIDLVLGQVPTYRDAVYCSLKWSQQNPGDLRLTREREVKLSD